MSRPINHNGRAAAGSSRASQRPQIVTSFQAEGVTSTGGRPIDPTGSPPTVDNAIETQIQALAFRRASRARIAAQAYLESVAAARQNAQNRPPPLPSQQQPAPPLPTAPQPASPTSQAMAILDTAFRGYAEKFQIDMANLRIACTRALYMEQQDKERLKSRCLGLKQELDIARQRVRALIRERESLMAANSSGIDEGRGVKRFRDHHENAENVQKLTISTSRSPSPVEPSSAFSAASSNSSGPPQSGSYPPSSAPPQSASRPPSNASPTNLSHPFDNESRVSQSHSSSRRRSSSSCPPPSASICPTPPSPALSSVSCPSLDLPSLRTQSPPLAWPLAVTAKRDGTNFDVTDVPAHTIKITRPRKKRRQSVEVEDGEIVDRGVGEPDVDTDNDTKSDCRVASTTPVSQPTSPQIEVTHVDLMYIPAKGKLTCRACLYDNKTASGSKAKEPKSFATDAPWDELREHCVGEHPTACADVARLHPAEIYELRRRLSLASR